MLTKHDLSGFKKGWQWFTLRWRTVAHWCGASQTASLHVFSDWQINNQIIQQNNGCDIATFPVAFGTKLIVIGGICSFLVMNSGTWKHSLTLWLHFLCCSVAFGFGKVVVNLILSGIVVVFFFFSLKDINYVFSDSFNLFNLGTF